MTALAHLFDETAGWEHRTGVAQLCERLSRDRFAQHLVTIDPHAKAVLAQAGLDGIRCIPRIARINALAAPLLRRQWQRHRIELVHAWGLSAAAAAAPTGVPLLVELFDPAVAAAGARLLRSISRTSGFAVVCSSQQVRRRLVEGGVNPELCVVLRPGVDFALLQKLRKSALRTQLGISPNEFLILLTEPRSRDENHLAAFWAAVLTNQFEGPYRVLVPGAGREAQRISRFAATHATPPVLVTERRSSDATAGLHSPKNACEVPFEQLLAIADALVIPQTGDFSTTAIAWAFGAGAVVIAAADYAVAELVVSKVNGLLYKHPAGKSPALRIIPLLRDREAQRKVKEAARGQAYEIFSLRRYVEQHVQLYENLLAGRPPSEGITDPAQVA